MSWASPAACEASRRHVDCVPESESGVDEDESVVRASEIVEANPVGLLHVWDGAFLAIDRRCGFA